MKILNRLTIKSLKLNKRRTIVTIIGIILATALITGVATLVTSIKETLITYQKNSIGDYHYKFIDLKKDEFKDIEKNQNIKKLSMVQEVGYTNLSNEYNKTFQPYGYIMEFSNEAINNLNIKLLEGRFPNNENEIVIQQQMISIGKINWNIGDEITLDIGKRTLNGKVLNQNDIYRVTKGNEEINVQLTKKYKIVGIINKVSSVIEPITAPGYTIISHIDNIKDENLTVYARYKNLNSDITELNKYEYTENTTLVSLESGKIEENMSALLGIATILTIIIIITSVYCIRNSFDISITEKVKQFGMLASIGATKKQIKNSVYFEGFILGIIAIPLGIIVGIISIFIILTIAQNIYKDTLLGVKFEFSISIISIILSIMLNSIVIYLSSINSAHKASKISPIEAIRSNQDIKIKPKEIKSPKLVKKIFGIGGEIAYKNTKRNNRKHKTILASIIISVSVFITISSFAQHSFYRMDYYYKLRNYNILVISRGNYETLKEISQNSNVKNYTIQRQGNLFVEEEVPAISIFAIGEQEYNRFIKELGLNYEETKYKLIWLDGETAADKYKKRESISNRYKKGDSVKVKKELKGETFNVEIAETGVEIRPLGMNLVDAFDGDIIVSDEFYDKYQIDPEDKAYIAMHINAENAFEMEEYIKTNFTNKVLSVVNDEENLRIEKGRIILISILFYTLIIVIALIGTTNLFNTLTTSIQLRQREFANLKSIGMTKKEFNKMIRLESLFYGIKSLLIALPIGLVVSYIIAIKFVKFDFIFPTNAILISVITVVILISAIMNYSLRKINKQNIIETIRKENI